MISFGCTYITQVNFLELPILQLLCITNHARSMDGVLHVREKDKLITQPSPTKTNQQDEESQLVILSPKNNRGQE